MYNKPRLVQEYWMNRAVRGCRHLHVGRRYANISTIKSNIYPTVCVNIVKFKTNTCTLGVRPLVMACRPCNIQGNNK